MADTPARITDFLKDQGIDIVGFGVVPSHCSVAEVNERFPCAIVFGLPLSRAVLETIEDRPTLLYKHHYKTVNWLLDQAAFRLARYIEELGNRALAVPASQTVDWEKQTGHVSHKGLALACGLGFIGRSGLVVHPAHGARVRYASVLTDLAFAPAPAASGTCGDCQKCVRACPAQAIGAEGIDLARCLAKLREFSRIRGIGQYICGVCVRACDGRR